MYPVSLFAPAFPYAKKKSTYTCCLCEVHSVLKEKSCPYKQPFSCQCAHVTVTFLSPQLFSCQCAPSLRVELLCVPVQDSMHCSRVWIFVNRDVWDFDLSWPVSTNGMKPRSWRVGFPSSPAVKQIAVNSVRLCLLFNETDCFLCFVGWDPPATECVNHNTTGSDVCKLPLTYSNTVNSLMIGFVQF